MSVRRLALRWLWWAFVWDLARCCTLNPWRFFVALPLWLVGSLAALGCAPSVWREQLWWSLKECWDAIEAGEVKRPPEWLARRLDPKHYRQLGGRS